VIVNVEEVHYMNQRNLLAGILTALAVTAAAGSARAEDACRANCDQWVAAWRRASERAPTPRFRTNARRTA
jgi:hypothetical protein